MFGIKPIRTIGIIVVLFLIFSATRINHPTLTLDNNMTDKTIADFMENKPKKEKKKKLPSIQDAVKIMHFLFKEKVKDSHMQCRYKKAKKRYFIACTGGDSIKDSYWEVSVKNRRIKLLARSKAAHYIINKYHFKELEADSLKANVKIEHALQKFFIYK